MQESVRQKNYDWNQEQHYLSEIWENFVIHFSTAHRDLQESGEFAISETSFQTANLVQEVIDGVQEALNPIKDNEAKVDDLVHQANITIDTSM